MNRFSEELPSLAAHKAMIYGDDEEKQYCAVCDSSHYAPICEPEPEEETGCTPAEVYPRIESRPVRISYTAQGELFGKEVA